MITAISEEESIKGMKKIILSGLVALLSFGLIAAVVKDTMTYTQAVSMLSTLSVTGDATLGSDLLLTDISAAVAAAGADQSAATALTGTINIVTTGTATSADGVKLPAAVAGKVVVIAAEYGDALAVWPATGDAIDDASANAEAAQADNTVAIYIAQDATTWRKLEN